MGFSSPPCIPLFSRGGKLRMQGKVGMGFFHLPPVKIKKARGG